jgi:hypothetical protein
LVATKEEVASVEKLHEPQENERALNFSGDYPVVLLNFVQFVAGAQVKQIHTNMCISFIKIIASVNSWKLKSDKDPTFIA